MSRGSVYDVPKSVGAADLVLMRRLDALHREHPFMGARMLRDPLSREGFDLGRTHVGTLMKRMGIEALFRKPGTSKDHLGHDVSPYLLADAPSTGRTRCGRSIRRTVPWPKGLST